MDESDEDMADAKPHVEEVEEEEEEEEEEDDEIIESDIELEGETVEPDNDPPQKVIFLLLFTPSGFMCLRLNGSSLVMDFLQMGDASVEVTDEKREASQEAKMQAMEALSEGTILFMLLFLLEIQLKCPGYAFRKPCSYSFVFFWVFRQVGGSNRAFNRSYNTQSYVGHNVCH